MLRRGLSASWTALRYGCIVHCTFQFIGDFVVCSGPSMEPTLHSDNVLIAEHISPALNEIRRGDIVIAKNPANPQQNICKRVVALPGDTVKGAMNVRQQVIPKGHVWLEGDNSSNSSDSRVYGPVPMGLIRSRAFLRIWPLDCVTFLA